MRGGGYDSGATVYAWSTENALNDYHRLAAESRFSFYMTIIIIIRRDM